MPTAGVTHDITIEDSDNRNRRGFMLARDRRGRRSWQIRDGQTIAPRQLTMGELSQAEFPAELELIWYQDNWQGGVGGVNHKLHPTKLASALKIDASEYGLLRLGKQVKATTVSGGNPDNYNPSGFALTPGAANNNMLLWAFIGRDIYHGGDDNWTFSGEPQAIACFYKNALQYGTDAIAPGWASSTDLVNAPVPYIFKQPSSATWTASDLTTTGGAFKYFAKARNSAGNEVVWGGHMIVDTGINVNGTHNDSTTTLACVSDPTSAIAVNDMVVAGEPGSREVMLVTATSSSNLTVVRGYGTDAQSYSGTSTNIYLYQPHVIRSSTDFDNSGSWSSSVAIGEDDQPITGLVVDGDTDTLLITKTDGIYSYTTDGQVRNLTPLFRQFGHTGNFEGVYPWNGHIFLPLGYGGLLDFNFGTSVIKDISFKITAPEQTDLHGTVLAMHGDPQNLFMGLKHASANTIYILRGQEIAIGEETALRWQNIASLGAGAALTTARTGLMVDTSLSDHRRVWTGITEADVSALPAFIPFDTTDQTDGYTADTDAEAVTVKFDAGLPRVEKRFGEIEIESANLSQAVREIAVDYRLDGDTGWSTLQTATISPFQTLNFPSGTTGMVLELRFRPKGSSVTTTSPEMKSFRVKMQLRPTSAKLMPLTVYLSEKQILLNGAIGGRPKGDLFQLRTWNEGAGDLLLNTPDQGKQGLDTERQVIFLPGSLVEQEISFERGRGSEYHVRFTLAEV